ncbi:MAG TPA: hypothetical protein VFB79_09155 [Candidatus Angelobacter sp.]|nr:hypothetical protein [Candidatus Angelobacter sp.]
MKISKNTTEAQAIRIANDTLAKLESLDRRVSELEKKVKKLSELSERPES